MAAHEYYRPPETPQFYNLTTCDDRLRAQALARVAKSRFAGFVKAYYSAFDRVVVNFEWHKRGDGTLAGKGKCPQLAGILVASHST